MGEVRGEPTLSASIHVVRGLVQEQELGVTQQGPGQGHTHLPAAGKLRARTLKITRGEAQAEEHLGHTLLHLVAACDLKALSRLVVNPLSCGHFLGRARPGPDEDGLGLLDFRTEGSDLHLGHGLSVDSPLGPTDSLLPQPADRWSVHVQIAAFDRLDASYDREQRRLPTTIGAHNDGSCTRVHLEVDVVEYYIRASAHSCTGELNSSRSPCYRRAAPALLQAPLPAAPEEQWRYACSAQAPAPAVLQRPQHWGHNEQR
mmetsp:Transcript_66306/g.148940  ORF Transcript_66306/g.148940 Transcript_66306/m.148940 type:complete len:259 (-) Transcript_66306:120-896(-)